MSQARWTARFERSFTGPASAVRARIWRRAYGPAQAVMSVDALLFAPDPGQPG